MSKIGILFCAFNCADTIVASLAPWKEIKNENFVYGCVSVPFLAYKDFIPSSVFAEDTTVNLVRAANIIDYHITEPEFILETQARGLVLEYLKNQGCDLIWMVDGDEVFTVEQINKTIEYINKNPEISWFKVPYKNYFDKRNTYLAELFTPPRIYRIKADPFILGTFYEDNNINYFYGSGSLTDTQIPISDLTLRNKIVPQAFIGGPIAHYSWLSNEISKNKIAYQKARGWQCSYQWNEELSRVEFNPNFYKNQELPKVIVE